MLLVLDESKKQEKTDKTVSTLKIIFFHRDPSWSEYVCL
jgi:hypothetical protein